MAKASSKKVLSMAVSLFDPVGLISPFAIRIRCTLLKKIKEGRKLVKPVSECYQQELQDCMDDFDSMISIQNHKYLIPKTNGTH